MAKMGCAKCGGTKKMALGGSAVKKAPVQLYGIPQENMGTSSQMGFGRNGGSVNINKKTSVMKKVKKMQDGGMSMSSTKTNMLGKSKDISNSRAAGKAVRFAKKPGSTNTRSTNINGITYETKPSANSNRSVTTTFKKVGGAVKKMQTGGTSGNPIEGYKLNEKTRNRIAGGNVTKRKETFINNAKGHDNKQVDRKVRIVTDKTGDTVKYKLKDTERPTVASKNQTTNTRVIKTDASGLDIDRSGKIPVRKGIAYRKKGGMVKTKKK